MIKYWPRRSTLQGFTESLGRKVKERLSKDLGKAEPKPTQTIHIHHPRVGIGHWANRAYEEYKKTA